MAQNHCSSGFYTAVFFGSWYLPAFWGFNQKNNLFNFYPCLSFSSSPLKRRVRLVDPSWPRRRSRPSLAASQTSTKFTPGSRLVLAYCWSSGHQVLKECVLIFLCVSAHQSDLEELLTDWSEDRSVGDIILKYVSLNDDRSVRFAFVTCPCFAGRASQMCGVDCGCGTIVCALWWFGGVKCKVMHDKDVHLSSCPPATTPFLLLTSFFQSRELVKAYPPFVNFFEMSKETIVRCEKQKPRFHAFLKVGKLLQSSSRLNQSNKFFFFFLCAFTSVCVKYRQVNVCNSS